MGWVFPSLAEAAGKRPRRREGRACALVSATVKEAGRWIVVVVSITRSGIVTLPCEERERTTPQRFFKRPRRPRATYSSPRCVARGAIELT